MGKPLTPRERAIIAGDDAFEEFIRECVAANPGGYTEDFRFILNRLDAARAAAPSVEPHDWRDHSSSPHHHEDGDPEPIWDRPSPSPEPTPGLQRRFGTPNDFMHYTHDVLDMHRGLMIPGCIYCNGDM